jgi:hypothetical protein
MREARHHHAIAGLELTVGDGTIQVNRDSGSEQIAALFEGVPVLYRL